MKKSQTLQETTEHMLGKLYPNSTENEETGDEQAQSINSATNKKAHDENGTLATHMEE